MRVVMVERGLYRVQRLQARDCAPPTRYTPEPHWQVLRAALCAIDDGRLVRVRCCAYSEREGVEAGGCGYGCVRRTARVHFYGN